MMSRRPWPRSLRRTQARGFTLVVVLVLLAALAWGTAASLRGTAGSTRVGQVQLMQAYAQEQAELALGHCRGQLLLPMGTRDPRLSDPALPLTTASNPAWASASLWRTDALLIEAPVMQPQSGSRWPVCFVERQWLPDQPRGLPIYVVTARGFSPDYRADPASGSTLAGSAFWLQSVLLIEDGQLRARTDRRLLNPPLR
jgi:hypothetical protein